MEPHRVVDARELQVRERGGVWQQRGVEQVVIGHIREQAAMRPVVVGRHAVNRAEPHLLGGRKRHRIDVIRVANGPEFERTPVFKKAPDFLRQFGQQFLMITVEVAQLLRRRHVWHRR